MMSGYLMIRIKKKIESSHPSGKDLCGGLGWICKTLRTSAKLLAKPLDRSEIFTKTFVSFPLVSLVHVLLDWFSETRLSKNVSLKWNTAWRPKLARSNSSSLWSPAAAVFFERRNATRQLRYWKFFLIWFNCFLQQFFRLQFFLNSCGFVRRSWEIPTGTAVCNHIKPWGLCHFYPKWSENNLCYYADSLDCLDTLTWKPWRHVQTRRHMHSPHLKTHRAEQNTLFKLGIYWTFYSFSVRRTAHFPFAGEKTQIYTKKHFSNMLSNNIKKTYHINIKM